MPRSAAGDSGGRASARRRRASAPALRARLAGARICICSGPGGVGKTTVSAALGLALAREGKRVVVVTIDPARRLAAVLGLPDGEPEEPTPTGEPRRVDSLSAGRGRRMPGELWAATLDVASTFEALVAEVAPDARSRAEVLSNRIYRELSSAVAGSQEVAAVAKLFELERRHDFDAIVLDTPPSRNALDFLDAPTRLAEFLEGRAMGMFLATSGMLGAAAPLAVEGRRDGDAPLHGRSAGGRVGGLMPKALAARVLGGGTGMLLSLFARASGVELIGELGGFFRLLSSLSDGLRERARAVEALLRDPATAFLIVTSPQRAAVQEAAFLRGMLARERMHYAGVVVNRLHQGGSPPGGAEMPGRLRDLVGGRLAERLARNLAEFDVLVRRDEAGVRELMAMLGEAEPVLVPQLPAGIDGIEVLEEVARRLLG